MKTKFLSQKSSYNLELPKVVRGIYFYHAMMRGQVVSSQKVVVSP